MSNEIDVGSIELSPSEYKVLFKIFKKGAVSDTPFLNHEDPYIYLYRLKLIERFDSDNFPHRPSESLSLPLNAFRITDRGRSVLHRMKNNASKARWQTVLSIVSIAISLAAFIKSFFFDGKRYTPVQHDRTRHSSPVRSASLRSRSFTDSLRPSKSALNENNSTTIHPLSVWIFRSPIPLTSFAWLNNNIAKRICQHHFIRPANFFLTGILPPYIMRVCIVWSW